MTINELREKRNQAWNAAKAFVETKRDKDGLLSEEDAKTYSILKVTPGTATAKNGASISNYTASCNGRSSSNTTGSALTASTIMVVRPSLLFGPSACSLPT